ncbi:MAG: glycosyltransferase family 9 protein [Opitutae bacterium]|nr:glycosyltransferase family 9 protein [Opitutae bacterium]
MPQFSAKSWFRSGSNWFFAPARMARLYPPPPNRPILWSKARRILVIKLDEIGDFLLVAPFLRGLRRAAPDAHLTLVVKPALLNLAETCPYVNRVLVYDGQTKGLSAWQLRRQWRAWRLARGALQRPRADIAVLPRWGEDAYNATYLAAMARPEAIVAYSESTTPGRRIMNAGFDRLLSHAVSPGAPAHEVEHHARLLREFGGEPDAGSLELWLTEQDRVRARMALPHQGPFVAIAPGARDELRRWPAGQFTELAAWLQKEHQLTPVVLGETADPGIGGAIDLRGRTTLREAGAVLECCRLFVGNDSGLKHLAAAARIPVVELSGFRTGGDPNHNHSPARFGAWAVPTRILQPSPGPGQLAVTEISLAAVQAACTALLTPP